MSTQSITLEKKADGLSDHEVVSREEWLIARRDLLKREKELTRLRDQLAAERRALPWVKIDKEYVFDAPEGEMTLAELFDGRRQLFIKHFMMAPGQLTQCVGCSLEVDHVDGILPHLENHDVTYVAVARAPIEEIQAVRKRMGWKFRWVSSYHSEFNYDFNVSFTCGDAASGRSIYNYGIAPEWAAEIEDLSGNSVFYKDDDGSAPVVEWLENLRQMSPDAFANCAAVIEDLEEFGHELRRPTADILREGIRELWPSISMRFLLQLKGISPL